MMKRNATRARILILAIFLFPITAKKAIRPIVTARITDTHHQTMVAYTSTNRITLMIFPHDGSHGIYRSIVRERIITRAIFDPLTTKICIIPESIKASFVFFSSKSVLPNTIHEIMADVSRGNPWKNIVTTDARILSSIDTCLLVIFSKVRRKVFP